MPKTERGRKKEREKKNINTSRCAQIHSRSINSGERVCGKSKIRAEHKQGRDNYYNAITVYVYIICPCACLALVVCSHSVPCKNKKETERQRQRSVRVAEVA